MAIATAFTAVNMDAWNFFDTADFTALEPTHIQEIGFDGQVQDYYGVGFGGNEMGITDGTLTGTDYTLNGVAQYSVTGLDHSIVTAFNYWDADNPELLNYLFNGADTMNGSSLNDIINAHSGNDTVYGNAGNDTLRGGEGNDTLNGGAGNDTMDGGSGNDTYLVNSVLDVVMEASSAGTDLVRSSATAHTLSANVENLTLTGSAAINGTGNTGNNVLTGNSANNVLNGGAGADNMAGGLGNDTYVVNSVLDVVTEASSAGTDLVQSSAAAHLLSANVENLTLIGIANVNGTGNAGNNVLTGNSANNVLNGDSGNDTLKGGLGNDTMAGGTGADAFIFTTALGAANIDQVVGFSVVADTIRLENSIFTSLTAPGTLAAASFRAGAGVTTAADGNDFVIYNTTNGKLYYDADGNAGAASQHFATLLGMPAGVTAADFQII